MGRKGKSMSNPSDFVIENGVLKKYAGPGGDVEIPESVTSIFPYAFVMCRNLTSLKIPDGVTAIPHNAALRFEKNAVIEIPAGVRLIGKDAFMHNTQKMVILSQELSLPEGACRMFRFGGIPYEETTIVAPFLALGLWKDHGLLIPAVRGFIEESIHYTNSDIRKEYVDYLSRQRKKYFPFLFEIDAVNVLCLLSEYKKIDRKNIESDYLIPAEESKAVKCAEYLKSLLNDTTTQLCYLTLDNQADRAKK